MSQPVFQLDTFRSWAGISSDISYYLNSHHVDFLTWCVEGRARPVAVTALQATGVASSRGLPESCADTITLSVQYEHHGSAAKGIASFTASWIAAPSDGHTQQGFSILCHGGQLQVDQTHRGYTCGDALQPGTWRLLTHCECVRGLVSFVMSW